MQLDSEMNQQDGHTASMPDMKSNSHKMRLVILESPFNGIARSIEYAKAAMLDCFKRGEAPLASHMLYAASDVLDDEKAFQRYLGIEAGLAWGRVADATICYTDLGISDGMRIGIARAEAEGRPVEYRSLSRFA